VVPNFDAAARYSTSEMFPLKLSEFQGTVLYLNRQTLETCFFGQVFRYSPTLEHAVLFEPKVKVITPRVMLLHHKRRHTQKLP
jgi:hypothetical protein